MGDLFHGEVPDWWIDEVFEGIIRNPQHRFLLLTKRPDRMAHYINKTFREKDWVFDLDFWMTNVWAGVSVEDQAAAEERIPALLGVSAAVRFVSVEPMLEPVDLQHIGSANARSGRLAALSGKIDFMRSRKFTNKLDWVICGGESGPGARPVHPDWVRFLRDECIEAGVPFFFKQWGEHCYPGQMPEDTYTEVDASVNLAGHYDRPWKVGKKKAGRLLDGVEWNQVPHSEES
jgi:protein gp37